MKKWTFSLFLLFTYLAAFHLWLLLEPPGVVLTGMATTLILCGVFLQAVRWHYFLNGWDALLHGLVILDILLEAALIPWHDNLGFYFCAAGFAAVIVPYRVWLQRRKEAVAVAARVA